MEKYYELLDKAYEQGFRIKEKRCFKSDAEALINRNVIGLSEKLQTQAEKKCALAEELSHFDNNVGNILDMKDTKARQQEYRARKEAIFDIIKPEDLIRAFEHHISNFFEMAEYLEVTEKFLYEALSVYKQHYGQIMMYEDYMISFEPFYVAQNFNYTPYELNE